ncbi:MAG: ATP synthase F1 subunit delta [Spirochaetales bacterium]|nr:ATP synthase F1 subunit delta [Spirochaetales bacterium]
MKITLVARRYATALFEIGEETNCIESITEDMLTIEELISAAPLIREYCFRRKHNQKDDREFISTAFTPYVSLYSQRLFKILAEHGRLSSLPFLPTAYMEILNQKKNRVTLEIESSRELLDSELKAIRQKMEKKIQKQIILKTKIRPELLGGFRIIWQNKILDYSAKGRFNQMRHEILDKSK